MGYESLDKDSLETLKFVLEHYVKGGSLSSQMVRDARYELDMINKELSITY